jgi:hypothetical protein
MAAGRFQGLQSLPCWSGIGLVTMPRSRYRQNGLPFGAETSPPELFGPEQPLPAGLESVEQGQLDVIPLGPLFKDSDSGSKRVAQP